MGTRSGPPKPFPRLSISVGWADIGGGIALAAASAAFLIGALRLPPSYNPADVGAGTFPLLAALVTGGLSLAMIVLGFLRLRRGSDEWPVEADHPVRVVVFLALMAAYLAGFSIIGVYVSTAIFATAAILLLGGRGLVQVVLPVASILLFLWLCFDMALKVVFPQGLLL